MSVGTSDIHIDARGSSEKLLLLLFKLFIADYLGYSLHSLHSLHMKTGFSGTGEQNNPYWTV
jgi:hypothetical protein